MGLFENKTEEGIINQESGTEMGVDSEANAFAGAEILENPADGSFIHGLQVFIAWVKTLIANDK